MPKLIFDIETVGEDFDSLDENSKEALSKWIKKGGNSDEDYERELELLKDGLGFSPFTGQVIAIGVFDQEKNKGVVTFQAPGEAIKEFDEGNIHYKQMDEKSMIENFWNGAVNYTEFITFNGRGFDVPFLMIRSAIHKIKPSKDLMSNRYIGSQKFGALHIDLQDQLTFYGCLKRRGGLHIISRAFGIKSPKGDGIKGDDVGRLFKERKFVEIAKYNAGDLFATSELYTYWKNYLCF